MSPPHLLLLFLNCSQQQQQCSLSPSDTSTLLDIKSNLQDLSGSYFFSSWDFTSPNPCSSFAGIIYSTNEDSGQFVSVSMFMLIIVLTDSPGLSGIFPPSIANLTALTELVVYLGHISGPIAHDIGSSLHQLRLVSISGTLIFGPIALLLAGLPDLHTLDLHHNQLQGPIPPFLFSSNSSLKVLILAFNGGLYGDMPTEISVSQLLHLDLRQNSLTIPLPPLPSTPRYLSVSANVMTGSLAPVFAGPISDLTFLDLSMNAFIGPIPPAIFSIRSPPPLPAQPLILPSSTSP